MADSGTPLNAVRRVLLMGAGPLPAADSQQAPGVANRLWYFAQPLITAGHDCLVVLYQRDRLPLQEARLPAAETRETSGHQWRLLPLHIEQEVMPDELVRLAREFGAERIIGAGTLLTATHAALCAAELGVPSWVDLFGDPLAEIQAKAEVLRAEFVSNELVMAWQLMLKALRAGSAFSTVSRRQADALLGQHLLAGRSPSQSGKGPPIHVFPCCVEEMKPPRATQPRDAWRAAHDVPTDAIIALWSGGFNAWADPFTLVRGLEMAMDKLPKLWFVATGGGLTGYLDKVFEDFQNLVAQSRHSGRMLAPGWLPLSGAEAWLAAADIGVVVDRSCAETRLGARNRLLVHAMGRQPVVATSGCEAVEEMAAAGALLEVESSHPAELATALMDLASNRDQRETLGQRGFDFCAKHYTFAATAGPLLEWVLSASNSLDLDNTEKNSGAMYIQHCMDPEARARELSELDRMRKSPLHRWLDPLRSRIRPK